MKHGIRILFVLGFLGLMGCESQETYTIDIEEIQVPTSGSTYQETDRYEVLILGQFTVKCFTKWCNVVQVDIHDTQDGSKESYHFPLAEVLRPGTSLSKLQIVSSENSSVSLVGDLDWVSGDTHYNTMPVVNADGSVGIATLPSTSDPDVISGKVKVMKNNKPYLRIKIKEVF